MMIFVSNHSMLATCSAQYFVTVLESTLPTDAVISAGPHSLAPVQVDVILPLLSVVAEVKSSVALPLSLTSRLHVKSTVTSCIGSPNWSRTVAVTVWSSPCVFTPLSGDSVTLSTTGRVVVVVVAAGCVVVVVVAAGSVVVVVVAAGSVVVVVVAAGSSSGTMPQERMSMAAPWIRLIVPCGSRSPKALPSTIPKSTAKAISSTREPLTSPASAKLAYSASGSA